MSGSSLKIYLVFLLTKMKETYTWILLFWLIYVDLCVYRIKGKIFFYVFDSVVFSSLYRIIISLSILYRADFDLLNIIGLLTEFSWMGFC